MSQRPGTKELLDGYRVEALRAMAARHGLTVASSGKAQVVAALVAHWRTATPRARAAAALDPAALAALHWLQRAGGSAGWEVLATMLRSQGIVDPPRPGARAHWSGAAWAPGQPEPATSRAFQDVMARLEITGMALGMLSLTGSSVLDLGTASTYHVPAEVWPGLPAPPPAPTAPVPLLAREVPGDPAAFGRELYLVFGHAWRHRPALTVNLRLTKRAMKAMLAEMPYTIDLKTVGGEEDIARLWFVRGLLMSLDLVHVSREVSAGAILTADAAAARAWWSTPLVERTRECLEAWQVGAWWNELGHLPGVTWRPSNPEEALSAPSAVRSARATAVQAVAHAASQDGWTSVAQAMNRLFLSQRDFLVPPRAQSRFQSTSAYSRYSAVANTRGWAFEPIRDAESGWRAVEGAFVHHVLICLRWLGLIDLGLDAGESPVAYRLTAMGRHLLTGGPRPAEADPAGGRVVLQPNFHILAIGPVPERTLLEIEQIAERRSVDRAIEFVLTRESVYRGQQTGLDAAAILARLTALTVAEVPQNVARTLAEWQSHHERVVVHLGARVLQAADPAVLDDLLGALARRPGGHIGERLSPTVARLPADAESRRALDACLAEADRTARFADDVPPAGSVTLDEDGEVHPRQHCPTLRVVGRLQRLADLDEATGRYRLTRASVQRARRDWGLDADAQFAAWMAIVVPPLPEWLGQRLKTWSGHYGAARLTTPVVLEVADGRTLAELRMHPALAGRLRPLRAPDATAIVDVADLDAVRAALEDLGIEVAEGVGASEPDPPEAPRRGKTAGAGRGRRGRGA